ncbi:phosphate ABC transporter membrane protein 2, PhoT family (TC 3.A.1.7.1) [Gracilibacillus ureilyticus]|uniref:Phosphate transport system permease protein PstA n=1 Tax=Gracilibacillus ureilyticus TaxID=531814 RepID=A0A1H9Q8M8_9BACI|nr:phosphate ABC transporter permease PstA [Gracilibacillus ureilyticus]SER56752.1 phosphate ABC transporter membrane protein 2, PhoT family (TC 3.A.1.7.1) [Gracilibacillus ureilyticus]
METLETLHENNKMESRVRKNSIWKSIFFLSTLFGLIVLAVLIFRVVFQGISWIDMDFITGRLSTTAENAGIMGAILGTLWVMIVVIPVTLIIGVGTAIYLELYSKKGKVQSMIETNIANLAGVPSIVYGLLGLTVFVRLMDFGNVVLAGGLTLALLVLPILIVSSQEALRAVPGFLAEASYGMGATKWQTIRRIILPAALPSILTGSILSLSRAIGETAPLTVIGIPALLIPFPGGLFDTFTALPMQIYYWTIDSSLVAEYANLAAATIIVLLLILFLLNSVAIFIRNKYQQRY